MAVNVIRLQHNGGFLPGTILFTQCYYHGGTRLNAMKRRSDFTLNRPASQMVADPARDIYRQV